MKFIIETFEVRDYIVTYEVEAQSEDEAVEEVKSGRVGQSSMEYANTSYVEVNDVEELG